MFEEEKGIRGTHPTLPNRTELLLALRALRRKKMSPVRGPSSKDDTLSEQEAAELNVAGFDDKSLRSALKNFSQLDRDNDGRLSREEFRAGLGMLGVDKTFSTIIFNSFDTGGDGWIDRREFLAAMAVMLHPDNLEAQIDLAFDAYDVDKNGRLEFDELRQVIAAVYSTMAQMGIGGADFNSDSVASELFRQMDRGAKGYVTKEDYLHLARTQPGACQPTAQPGNRPSLGAGWPAGSGRGSGRGPVRERVPGVKTWYFFVFIDVFAAVYRKTCAF